MPPSATLVKAAEETEARTVFRSDGSQDVDSPAYESLSYREQLPDVTLIREVAGGTKTMRKQGKKYLPQHPMETSEKYKARLNQAVAFNAVRKTVEGLSGMIFRRDPSPSDDMPNQLREHLKNVNQRGDKLAVFLHAVADDALTDGHAWIHIESPPTEGLRNAAEAEAQGVRPYWIRIKKRRAINWRSVIRAGKPVLTLFVYREGSTAPSGGFGEEQLERIRVLREGTLDPVTKERGPVTGELWELREEESTPSGTKEKRWVRIDEYTIGVSTVPVVFVPSEETGEFESRPPLLDLAYEQIEHYRVRSDRQKSMTFASLAVPYVFGRAVTDEEGTGKVTWGPDGMLLLNDPEASAGILESQGFGLAATKEELVAIKENMASLGVKMLVRASGVNPATATSDLLNKSEGDASLAQFAVALEDATNQALNIHAEYEDRIDKPGSVRLNRDFYRQLLTPQDVQVLGEQVASGRLSLDTMWARMVRGDWFNEDFDPEEERARIDKDGATGLVDLFGEGGEEGAGGEKKPPPVDDEGTA